MSAVSVLFTSGSSALSKAIRKSTGEPVSHVALCCGDWVAHSNLLGVRVESRAHFESHCQVIFEVPRSDIDSSVLLSMMARAEGRPYDLGALVYLWLLRLPLFRCILPKTKNLWQDTGMFLCTEFVSFAVTGKEDSTITPYQLYLQMRPQ